AIKTNALSPISSNDGSIVLDNGAASVVGTWTTASSATDKYGADYRYKGMGTGAAYLQYTPTIAVPKDYQIFEWHTQGGNRSAGTPHIVSYNGGTATININQTANGGKWNLLGTFNMISGAAGYVRITDGFTDATQIAIADAIKFLPVPSDIIMDNASASLVGSWTTGTSSTDKYGANYNYKGPGTGAASCQFVPNVAASGVYQVYEWHTAGANRAVDAKYRLNNGDTGASQTFVINQTGSGGTWNLLGTFSFSQGTACTVSVVDNFTTGTVIVADAVKLVYVSQ
ncbi:MAG: type secretion protein Rhs, partial [Verrucomicrobiales bacterium]|nr:type secretion protein Rhs [Verrucomicrobiales bacterium]